MPDHNKKYNDLSANGSEDYGKNVDAFSTSVFDNLKPVRFVYDFFDGVQEGYREEDEPENDDIITDEEYNLMKEKCYNRYYKEKILEYRDELLEFMDEIDDYKESKQISAMAI